MQRVRIYRLGTTEVAVAKLEEHHLIPLLGTTGEGLREMAARQRRRPGQPRGQAQEVRQARQHVVAAHPQVCAL